MLFCMRNYMKKLLSVIIAASLLTSSAFAAPAMVSGMESAAESSIEEVTPKFEVTETLGSAGPVQTSFFESAKESPSDAVPSNVLSGDASLMFSFYAGGDGSEESPYEIANTTQLKYFSQMINSGNDIEGYYKLTSDIDLEGEAWTPVGFYSDSTLYSGAFKGHFDGDGHTVSNFKITVAEHRYVGFFGLAYNAEIKNLTLDNVTIDIDRSGNPENEVFAGILAGRAVGDGIGGVSIIENCHTTNSTLRVVSDKNIYAGGIVGCTVAGKYSEVEVFDISADCDVSVSLNATGYLNSTTLTPYYALSGGLYGYFGAITDGVASFRNARGFGDVYSESTFSEYVFTFSGGAFGQIATRMLSEDSNGKQEIGGTLYMSSVSASGKTSSDSKRVSFCGGFAANIGATENFHLSDCYASGDSNGSTTAISVSAGYVAAGGFVGQLDFDEANYSDSMDKLIVNCYASGDAIDTLYASGKSIDSYVGGFAGYSFAPVFMNCYMLEAQNISGKNVFTSKGISTVTEQESTSAAGYPAFDFNNVWYIDASAEYPYPVFREICGYALFFNESERFAEVYFGNDGLVSVPSDVPQKKGDKEWKYTFSHWSLSQDGEAFDFENTALTQNTEFYAVYTMEKQVYNVSFMSEGKSFGSTLSVPYGEKAPLPDAVPSKPETSRYRYDFSHWSLTEGGEEADFDTYTVTGDVTFHAVFIEIDKTAWNGAVASSFSEGHGTSSLPYIISSAEEFALLAKVINEGDSQYTNAYYALGDDIHLGYNTWEPIGTKENPFSANLNGGGYEIKCFRLVADEYAGLFGYVKNASITDIYISDYIINIDSYISAENMYAGGLAAYIDAKGTTNTVISGVRVQASKFDISANVPRLYAGTLAGYVNTNVGKVLISDCYGEGDIIVTNAHSSGLTDAGGLVGYMYTYASSLAKISTSYFIGSVTAGSANMCNAGGIAGELFSMGSDWLPPVEAGSLSSELADYDVMLENSFVIASVSATSDLATSATAYAGVVAGSISQFAGLNNVFFQRSTPIVSSGTVRTYGTSASATSLLTKTFLNNTVGFDFANVWTYVGDGKYPVLKAMYSEKPIFRLNNVDFTDGTLSASVTALAKADYYTVTVSVYNERNQLIAVTRQKLTSSEIANEFDVSFSNLSNPYRVKVSAIDSLTFVPLFTAIEWYL